MEGESSWSMLLFGSKDFCFILHSIHFLRKVFLGQVGMRWLIGSMFRWSVLMGSFVERLRNKEKRARNQELRTTSHESRATNHESRATSHEPRTTNHELRITSHETRATNHEPRATNHEPRTTNQGVLLFFWIKRIIEKIKAGWCLDRLGMTVVLWMRWGSYRVLSLFFWIKRVIEKNKAVGCLDRLGMTLVLWFEMGF